MTRPDVVVLNASMPVLNGLDAAKEIKAALQKTIVIPSSDADDRFVDEAKRIGAHAYVAKSVLAEALVKAIEAAIEGGDFVCC